MRKGAEAHLCTQQYLWSVCRPLTAILATGRTKELTPELKEDFIRFTKSLGLTDDHILFPVPIGNGHLGRGERDTGPVHI